MTGVVFDPTNLSAQEELRSEVRQRGLWAVLDTRLMELATRNGHTERRSELPWAGPEPHRPQDLSGAGGRSAAAAIVNFIAKYGFNAILLGHYLEYGASDTWFTVDRAFLGELRRQLDAQRLDDVALYLTLAVSTSTFHDPAKLAAIKDVLVGIELDGLWLRVHPLAPPAVISRCSVSFVLAANCTRSIGLSLSRRRAALGFRCWRLEPLVELKAV